MPAGRGDCPELHLLLDGQRPAWNGLEPVFADVDPQTFCIDVEDVRRLITPRTVGIAAVHVFGLPAVIEPLEGLAPSTG